MLCYPCLSWAVSVNVRNCKFEGFAITASSHNIPEREKDKGKGKNDKKRTKQKGKRKRNR